MEYYKLCLFALFVWAVWATGSMIYCCYLRKKV